MYVMATKTPLIKLHVALRNAETLRVKVNSSAASFLLSGLTAGRDQLMDTELIRLQLIRLCVWINNYNSLGYCSWYVCKIKKVWMEKEQRVDCSQSFFTKVRLS